MHKSLQYINEIQLHPWSQINLCLLIFLFPSESDASQELSLFSALMHSLGIRQRKRNLQINKISTSVHCHLITKSNGLFVDSIFVHLSAAFDPQSIFLPWLPCHSSLRIISWILSSLLYQFLPLSTLKCEWSIFFFFVHVLTRHLILFHDFHL